MQEIAEKGAKIYQELRENFEPAQIGKFLAIEVGSGDSYLAEASSEAVEQARKAHPNTIFYVVKIGHSVAETLAGLSSYAHGIHH